MPHLTQNCQGNLSNLIDRFSNDVVGGGPVTNR
jgi:hypothetical protein